MSLSSHSLLLLLAFTFLRFESVNGRTCCCAAFTYESCMAEHDTAKGHCVWRQRPSFGPSTGEKGICRTEQWVEIQKDSNNHHPMHTTSSTLSSIPFISLPKKSADPLSNDDIIAHESDPANPDNYDWPNVCFTDEAQELECNLIETNKNAEMFVEVGRGHNIGKRVSVGVISIVLTLIAFIVLIFGFGAYWKGNTKNVVPEQYALDDINVVRTYSTFQTK